MRWMGWSYADLKATPLSWVETALARLAAHAEAERKAARGRR